jgi:hypothetical protein
LLRISKPVKALASLLLEGRTVYPSAVAPMTEAERLVMEARVEVLGKCGAPRELLQLRGEIHVEAVRLLVLEPCNP